MFILDHQFCPRNPESRWKNNYDPLQRVPWIKVEIAKGFPLEAIVLPEFQNRFAYVSLYASSINQIVGLRSLSKNQLCELVYAALLSRSSLQFHWILLQIHNQWDSADHVNKNHPFLFYNKICQQYGLSFCGGVNPRYTSTGDQCIVKTVKALQNEMETFGELVEKLNKGELLKNDGKWKGPALKGIGDVCFISFPLLTCFVGLGKTEYAIQMAKLAPVNTRKGSYFCTLQKKLEIKADDHNPSDNSDYYFSLWKAVGKSIGENVAMIENSVCGWLRETKRSENFVKEQSLYTLLDGCNMVFEKEYDSEEWIEFKSPCLELQ